MQIMGHLIFQYVVLYFFWGQLFLCITCFRIFVGLFRSIVIGNLFSCICIKQSWYSAIGASGGVSGIFLQQ